MLFDKCFLFKYLLHTHIYTHTTILIHFFVIPPIFHTYTHIHKHFNVLNIVARRGFCWGQLRCGLASFGGNR